MAKFASHFTIGSRTLLIVVMASAAFVSCGLVQRKGDSGSGIQKKRELRTIIPQAPWEPIFFRDINQRSSEANLPSLRTILLPDDDLEIRLWFVAGYYGVDGVILRRAANQWSGSYLYGFSKDPHFKKYQKPLGPPRSGWETAWQNLTIAGLLTLPDAAEKQCNNFGLDGIAYVVETNTNQTYRTYMYDDPPFAKCDEAKQMIRLIEIVNREFDLDWPATK